MGIAEIKEVWDEDHGRSEEGYLAHLGMGCSGKDEEADKMGRKGGLAKGQYGQRPIGEN